MVKVLSAGFYTSIQDAGRKGFAHYGVPKGGAMDERAATWGNHLLQNTADCAVLEVTFGGCKLEFLADTYICITGADFTATLNEVPIPMYKPVGVQRNGILSFGKRKQGVRTYIAIAGGFKTPSILGSRSFLEGITQCQTVQKGDLIPFGSQNTTYKTTNTSIKIDTSYFNIETVYCTQGSEFNLLSGAQKALLFSTQYTISVNNNRMGYQLNELLENSFSSMLTSAVLPGTVQLTPSGKLIVLMQDCQVTGGYPRVLQITEESMHTLAQKTTGNGFVFALAG